jgi:hypothetical protein
MTGGSRVLLVVSRLGAHIAVFSVLYSMLLRPLPFPDADGWVAIEAEIETCSDRPSCTDATRFTRE